MNEVDSQYRALLSYLLTSGEEITTRNSPVKRVFPWQCTFSSVPLVTLRKTAWKNCLREWEWFMSGSSAINKLHPSVKSWWEPWGSSGYVSNNYSEQFRSSAGRDGGETDQIAYLLEGIADHPFSRRNVITTWNTADMISSNTPITNCHGTIIQAFCDSSNALSLVTYQRSVDVVCGLPHNWFQYWAFLVWLSSRTARKLGKLIWLGGDVHLYKEHESLAEEIVQAKMNVQPSLVYTPSSEDFLADDFKLEGEYLYSIDKKARMVV